MNEIKIGDTVDCSGHINGDETCSPGVVVRCPDEDGEYKVGGMWGDDEEAFNYVRPDQITRHVPAPPVVERPKSCGDKLASEMTVRVSMTKDLVICMLNNNFGIDNAVEQADNLADALIAALDKERT